MTDVNEMKDRLAQDGCQVNLKTIQKALMMPEANLRYPSSFQYPNPKVGLMVNPWPKVVKKKKKGKK